MAIYKYVLMISSINLLSQTCKGAVYKFINSMIEVSKYCSEKFTKSWICNFDYVENDVKVRDHCYITEKYRDIVISTLKN